jgi:hypothetical protein
MIMVGSGAPFNMLCRSCCACNNCNHRHSCKPRVAALLSPAHRVACFLKKAAQVGTPCYQQGLPQPLDQPQRPITLPIAPSAKCCCITRTQPQTATGWVRPVLPACAA